MLIIINIVKGNTLILYLFLVHFSTINLIIKDINKPTNIIKIQTMLVSFFMLFYLFIYFIKLMPMSIIYLVSFYL